MSTAQARTKCVCVCPRYRDLVQEVLPTDLFQRSVQRSYHVVSYINLAKRTLLESLYRGFYKRDIVQRHCIEHRDLLRPCPKAPYRDLERDLFRDLEQRSCRGLTETLYSDIVKILLQRFCQEVSGINLAKRGFFRELVQRSHYHKEILPSHRDVV